MKSFFTIVLTMMLFFVPLCTTAFAQNAWDAKVTGTPSVLFINGKYHMWYAGNDPEPVGSIGYASSLDGINWTKYEGNPVLVAEPTDGWNEKTVYEPNVIFVDSLFHMWYTSSNDPLLPGPCYIHHATSADGLNWSKDIDHNPGLSPGPGSSWDYKWVDSHCIIRVDTIYHMWYAGCNLHGVRIGHATSPDGVNWTKDVNNPVLTFDALGSWEYPKTEGRVEGPNVVYDGSKFHLWYVGGNHSAWKTGYATSDDGVTWVKHAGNPVLNTGPAGSWYDQWVGFVSVLWDPAASIYKMWYSGSGDYLIYQNSWGMTGQTGYATSPDGFTWTKLDDPVISEVREEISSVLPENFLLFQNYPNPFNPSTVISWQTAVGSMVDLSVYNVLGEKVATLVSKWMNPGSHSTRFDGTGLPSGVYYYRVTAGDPSTSSGQRFHDVKKMILLR